MADRDVANPIDIGRIAAAAYRVAPLGPENAEELRAVTSDPAVTSVIPFLPEPFGLQQAQALLERQGNGRDLYLGIRAGGDYAVPGIAAGTLLGVVGVHLRGAEDLEIGYWLPGRYHRLGIAGAAVPAAAAAYAEAFPARRVVAECHPDNTPSRRVLARAGFRATGQAGERPDRDLYAYAPGG